jgi:predicted nucleic acid-binding protein
MSRYLLDTNILIHFSKGRNPEFSWVSAALTSGEDVGVCAINVAEFFAGIAPVDHPRWRRFFDSLSFWPLSQSAARRAGSLRYDFARRGHILSTADTLLAAVAEEQAAELVTGNVRHYPMTTVRVLYVGP